MTGSRVPMGDWLTAERVQWAMSPAVWDDATECDTCGLGMTVDEAHHPHDPDCPQMRWGANACQCDQITCSYCCTDPACQRQQWPVWALLLALWIGLLLCIAVTVLIPDGHGRKWKHVT